MDTNYIKERKTISMNGSNTPGSASATPTDYDLNGACVPGSKEEGGNLKKTEASIHHRFSLCDCEDETHY